MSVDRRVFLCQLGAAGIATVLGHSAGLAATASGPAGGLTPATAREAALKLWPLRGELTQVPLLLTALEAWSKAEPASPLPLILFSRTTYFAIYMMEIPGTREDRMALVHRGLEAGRRAASLAPKDPGGDFWAACNLAVYGTLKGIMESVSSYSEIKERLAKVEKLEPDYFHGGVYRFNGRLIDQVPSSLRFAFGYSLKDALQEYQRALKVEPRYIQTHFFYGEALLQNGEPEKARAVVAQGLGTAPGSLPEVEPENRVMVHHLKRLQRRIGAG